MVIEEAVRQARGGNTDQIVELFDRFDVSLARDRDAILGSLKLSLKLPKVPVGLEFRIAFDHNHQPTQCLAKSALSLLELLDLLRRRIRGVDRGTGRAGPGIHYGFEGLPLVARIAFDGVHEIGDQVRAPFVLIRDFRDARFHTWLSALGID